MAIEPVKQTTPQKPKPGFITKAKDFLYVVLLKFMGGISYIWSLLLTIKSFFKFNTINEKFDKEPSESNKNTEDKNNKPVNEANEPQENEEGASKEPAKEPNESKESEDGKSKSTLREIYKSQQQPLFQVEPSIIKAWKIFSIKNKGKEKKVNSLFTFYVFHSLKTAKEKLLNLFEAMASINYKLFDLTGDAQLSEALEQLIVKGELSKVEKTKTKILLNCFKNESTKILEETFQKNTLLSKKAKEEKITMETKFFKAEVLLFKLNFQTLELFFSEVLKEETARAKNIYIKESFVIAFEEILSENDTWECLSNEEKTGVLTEMNPQIENLAESFFNIKE